MPMLPDVQERPASMEATHEPLAPRPYGETLISLLARNAKEAPSRDRHPRARIRHLARI